MLTEIDGYSKSIELYTVKSLKGDEEKIKKDILKKLPFLNGVMSFVYFEKLPRTSIGKAV